MNEESWVRVQNFLSANRKSKPCPELCRTIQKPKMGEDCRTDHQSESSEADRPEDFAECLGAGGQSDQMTVVNRQWAVVRKTLRENRKPKIILVCLLTTLLLTTVSFAEAQQQKKIPRIGFVVGSSSAMASQTLEPLRQGLRDVGYVDGVNFAIEARWAEGMAERLPHLISELIRLKVDVMVVGGAAGALAAKNAKVKIPIVFAAVTDPFEKGLIASLARPGANITGTSLAVGEGFSGKWVELLKETVPKVSRFSVLWNPDHPVAQVFMRETKAASLALGVRLHFFEARDPSQLDTALSKMEKEHAGALLVTPDPLFFTQRKLIADFAARRHLPSTFLFREFAEAGGLMTYGPSISDSFRRAARYVDKILKGANPADLPVEQPTKFELVVNLKTAKQIGVTIPPNVLARADKVIK
jgi:putative ABC transport system substrate-binding protein